MPQSKPSENVEGLALFKDVETVIRYLNQPEVEGQLFYTKVTLSELISKNVCIET